MASSGINKVILVGNLGGNPELKHIGNSDVCEFSLATNESWKDKDGQKQERTEWHSVKFWNKPASIITQYAKKGDKLYVEGKLQTRNWEKDGVKHYKTEIIGSEFRFLSGKNAGQGASEDREPSGDTGDDTPF